MSPEEQAAKLFYEYRAMIPTGCDIFHFFNTINYSSLQPWVVSVESGVPWPLEVTRCVESINGDLSPIQNNKYVERALRYLSQPNCLALLALSDCTKKIQMEIIRQFPQYEQNIRKKLVTLHPAQDLIINSIDEKGLTYRDEEELTFFYVGRNFYRKGGRETLEVLADLHKRYDFRLIMISGMDEDEARYMRTDSDAHYAQRIIEENQDWIDFYKGLPNQDVLNKAIHSHVALLPTWMDTYGYSILETMACGTPTISTSLRALTEINDEEVGWLINVPVNRLNNPIHNTREEQDHFYQVLKSGLRAKVEYVLLHRQEIRAKAENCLYRIKKNHSPEEYVRKLQAVYAGNVSQIIDDIHD